MRMPPGMGEASPPMPSPSASPQLRPKMSRTDVLLEGGGAGAGSRMGMGAASAAKFSATTLHQVPRLAIPQGAY